MPTFIHLSDTHLGFRQYGLEQRAEDFARSFEHAASEIIAADPDFCIISGDLFHHRQVDPAALRQAVSILSKIKSARGTPVYAVAGNHDLGWRRSSDSWLTLLADLGLLQHLDMATGAPTLLDPSDGTGPLVEMSDHRVVGIPYVGAALPCLLERVTDELRALPRKYTVLVMHAGLDGYIPHITEPLRPEHLAALEGVVDYVALGHRHRPFTIAGPPLVMSPGSLEATSSEDADVPGWLVTVAAEPAGDGTWAHDVATVETHRRPFLRVTLDVSPYANPDDLRMALLQQTPILREGEAPILSVSLQGSMRFATAVLELPQLTELVRQYSGALHIVMRNYATPLGMLPAVMPETSRSELEHMVLREAIARDSRYTSRADALATLAADLKARSLAGDGDKALFQTLEGAVGAESD